MKKRGVILVLGFFFLISSLIVVFNSYNVSNPIISDNNPSETENSYNQNTIPKSSDTYDPNDIFSNAAPIGEGIHGPLDLGPDEDWYRIPLNFEESIAINITFLHINGNIDLELRNFTNDILATSYSFTDNESIFFVNMFLPGDVFIRVFNVTLPTNYDLEIKIDDRFEPNNDLASAVDIGMSYYSSLRSHNDDWFKIWLNNGEEFTVDLFFQSSIGDLDLELWNNTIMLKDSRISFPGNDRENIIWTASYSGYHYIYIVNNAVDNYYDLNIYYGSDDPFEENDILIEAKDIGFGYYSNLFCKDNDWFKFWVNDGEQFTVEIYFDNNSGNLELELYNSTGNYLTGSYSNDNDEYITWTAAYPDWYHINIYNFTNANHYDLNIYTSSFGEDFHEENDIFDEAWDISPGYYPGLFCQDDDWFRVWINSGERFRVELYFDNYTGDLDLELYAEYDSITPMDGSYSTEDNEMINWIAGYSGWYYIRIFHYGFFNDYDMDIFVEYDKYEPNNDYWTPFELYKGFHRDLLCKDEDWYSVWMNVSEPINVDIYFENISGNLDLELYDIYSSFSPVAWSNSLDDDESISYIATYTGYYFIKVFYVNFENRYDMKIGGQELTIFYEDFEGPLSPKWSGFGGNNYWHVTSRDSSPSSPTHSVWCGNEITTTYNKKADGKDISYRDSIVLTDLDLRDYCYVELSMDYKFSTGTSSNDKTGFSARVLGEEFYLNPKYTDNVFELGENYGSAMGWSNFTYDLSFFSGYDHVEIIFYFEADEMDNNYEGIMVDNIRITGIKDEVLIGNTLDIDRGDEFYYYISYIDEQAWSKEIFGKDIPRFAGMIKLEIFGIYDRGDYWDVIARFWEPWDDFDELKNTEEISYSVYKNPLNMKNGADFFLPSNNLGNYIDRGDNFDWYQNYDIEHWYEPMWSEYRIEYCFDNFRVHLTYSSNGILLGMSIHKNYGNGARIFEMWRDDNKDHGGDDEEEERDAIPGYDITIIITIIAAMSIITTIRVKKLRRK